MSPRRRTGAFGTLGAWLRIWTPPRGVEVPPPPGPAMWTMGALAIAAGTALVLLVIAPAIEDSKKRSSAAKRRAAAAAKAVEDRRLAADQRLRSAAFAGEPVPALERAITRDARSRGLGSEIGRTDCRPYRQDPRARERGKYECVAVITDTKETEGAEAATFGYPFWARVDSRENRLRWCKINPRAGEGGAVPASGVQLPRGCNVAAR